MVADFLVRGFIFYLSYQNQLELHESIKNDSIFLIINAAYFYAIPNLVNALTYF